MARWKPVRRVVLGLVAVAVIAVACSSLASSSSGGSTSSSKVGQGLGTQDATGDVTLGACHDGGAYAHDLVKCRLTIVNHSGGTSDYYVEAQALRGTTIVGSMINASATAVPANGKASVSLSGLADGKWDQVKITQIQRTASV